MLELSSYNRTIGLPQEHYFLHDNSALTKRVQKIEKIAIRGIIREGEIADLRQNIDARHVLTHLPEGLSESEFIDINRTTLRTEAGTKIYADGMRRISDDFKQPWHRHFIDAIWEPDEEMHPEPYKYALLDMGFSERELERDLEEARETTYKRIDGMNPATLDTFASLQEYFTKNWHGKVASIYKGSGASPATVRGLTRIMGREGAHQTWDAEFVNLQLIDNPALMPYVVDGILRFQMPGWEFAPDLQKKAAGWLPLIGVDPDKTRQELVLVMKEAQGGDLENLGKMVFTGAEMTDERLGPFSLKTVKSVIDKTVGSGNQLMGEALLQSVGLDHLLDRQDSGFKGLVRSGVRTIAANKIDEFIKTVTY